MQAKKKLFKAQKHDRNLTKTN